MFNRTALFSIIYDSYKSWEKVKMVDENEFFRQATLRISSSLKSETALQRCMTYLKQHMPVSGIVLGLYDPNLNMGRLLSFIWPSGITRPEKTFIFPKEYWGWMKNQWENQEKIRIINDFSKEEMPLQQVFAKTWPNDTSHIMMGLRLDEMRLGTLGLFVEGKHRYNESHAHLISLLHEPFAIAISNILQHQEILRLKDILADDNRYLRQEIMEITGKTIIGADFGLRSVMEMVSQVAPLNSPVLLLGETGVGKEVIANAIHYSSKRKNNPYIRVNCGAIPESLIDSELFGHEKGAFTGAISNKRGRFERANAGTIFLDEVGELPPAAQVRLLRVIQQREIERVGGTETLPVDVRIISATHQNLEVMVKSGTFREDLFYRLNVFPITIPPLRYRADDIPALVNHFLEHKSRELGIEQLPSITQEAIEQLQAYRWPGNVRELENFVERALIQTKTGMPFEAIAFSGLARTSDDHTRTPSNKTDESILPMDDIIAMHIKKALAQTRGKVEGIDGAANLLKIHPSTLRGRMRKLGIPFGRQR
ncbi:ATPase AAA [Desulfosarcina ovata subsp. sediminis]|uniref:ATPase AAA n=2 Tax=Desulfosarcina ovata TaxID=83564 RepID=A0A5K7ZRA4_9BACT|nr:ATPase AAA [Desulfosarcina ovata subsp. sediminis]